MFNPPFKKYMVGKGKRRTLIIKLLYTVHSGRSREKSASHVCTESMVTDCQSIQPHVLLMLPEIQTFIVRSYIETSRHLLSRDRLE